MVEHETLDALAAELERMPASHRRQVLASLTPAERKMLDALVNPEPSASTEPPADIEARFSPWLAERLREAEAGEGAMTSAARQALLRAAREVVEGPDPAPRRPGPRPSLMQIIVGRLKPRQAAR